MADEPEDPQVEIFRRMTPEQELRAAERLYWSCAPAEVIRIEAQRSQRGHFNIIHHETGFKADMYIAGEDPLHRWALANRRRMPFGAATISVAPPEYVIVRKLQYYREGRSAKHIGDIRGILRQQGDGIDREELASKVARLGLQAEWAEVLAK